jgi:hypothetical protein
MRRPVMRRPVRLCFSDPSAVNPTLIPNWPAYVSAPEGGTLRSPAPARRLRQRDHSPFARTHDAFDAHDRTAPGTATVPRRDAERTVRVRQRFDSSLRRGGRRPATRRGPRRVVNLPHLALSKPMPAPAEAPILSWIRIRRQPPAGVPAVRRAAGLGAVPITRTEAAPHRLGFRMASTSWAQTSQACPNKWIRA